jgi:hypothetical protein
MMNVSPSLGFLPFKVTKKCRRGISVSPAGAIAVFANRVCTIWLDNGRSFDPLYGFIPFSGSISQICWCKGPNAHNEIPLDLFLANCEGNATVVDVVAREVLASFSLQEGQITAAEWHLASSRHVFVGTSDGFLHLYHIASKTGEIVRSVQFGFSIDFIRISPFDSWSILVADVNGTYSRIHGRHTSYNPSGSSLGTRTLMDVAFHPFLSDAIIFVFEFILLLLFS